MEVFWKWVNWRKEYVLYKRDNFFFDTDIPFYKMVAIMRLKELKKNK